MAFFGVLAVPQGQCSFEVEQCHLNLWVLPRRFRPHQFLWDVGLLLSKREAVDTDSFALQLALPFGTTRRAFSDLAKAVTDSRTAELIFGEPVVLDGNLVKLKSLEFQACPISPDLAARDEELSGADHSLWTFKDIKWPVDGRKAYVRVRFHVSRAGQIWVWQPSRVQPEMALIDIRVSDVRGAASDRWRALEARVQELRSINLFVIAPFRLRSSAHSPELHYVRLLEQGAWTQYVGRKLTSKLAIYHWKRPIDSVPKPISVRSPYLAFIALEPNASGFVESLRISGLILFFFVAVSIAFDAQPRWLLATTSSLSTAGKLTWWILTFASIPFFQFISRLQLITGLLRGLRDAWLRFQQRAGL
jgi:hypothetical protein